MTNAELLAKIKAEIERLRATNPSEFNYQNAVGYNWALDDVLSFLSTLESEKSMEQDKNLDKEIKRYINEYYQTDSIVLIAHVARHFAKWGAEHAKIKSEKPVPKDLEEAANHYANVTDPEAHGIDFIREVFMAGAEWQKEQDEKEAVECMVTTNLANRPAIYLDQLKGFEYGDKVKIIIVKEDEK